MRLGGGQILLKGCTFSGNTAGEQGGGLYSTNTGVTMVNCELRQNSSGRLGGGAFLRGSDQLSTIATSVFSENTATSGGGAFFEHTPVAIGGTLFKYNESGHMGGGIYCWGGNAEVEVDGCTFLGNTAPVLGGGAAVVDNASATLTRSTFYGNQASGVAGLYVPASDVTLSELIVANNGVGRGIEVSTHPVVTSHCCVYANAGGDSLGGIHYENLFTDPLFCDAANQDLTLHENSPCLPENNDWGVQMGAWGKGCVATDAEEMTWGRLKAMFR